MKNPTFATRWNADLIDQNYEIWLREPDRLDREWNAFFEGFELAGNGHDSNRSPLTKAPGARPFPKALQSPAAEVSANLRRQQKQACTIGAIYAYRSIGHTQAQFNPLVHEAPSNPRLSLERLGFGPEDFDDTYHTGNYLSGVEMTVGELLSNLYATYCGPIGVEYLHIQETRKRRWLQARIEPNLNVYNFSRQRKFRILDKVMEAEIFEKFLHTRYVGQKRFSLEGGETLLACLDALLEKFPQVGVHEIVMGMAHRGRLNVLANVLRKSYNFIFREFTENYIPDTIHGDGDVKYHLGYDSEITTSSGETITVRLAANPSHLEAVDPVVEGRARARQRILGDLDRKMVLPILIHGDAAFAGQGMVSEVLNLSKLSGYTTGGTIHFVVNNQIGFTTNPSEARSSLYCTDVAKMIEAPIFHVNGDDPFSMVHITEMALDYRQEFGEDVVIDMYCYRRHGHNESDEPTFTQPLLYKEIHQHPMISEMLSKRMMEEGELTAEEAASITDRRQRELDEAFRRHRKVEEAKPEPSAASAEANSIFQPPYSFRPVKTRVRSEVLDRVAKALTRIPERIKINPKIRRQLTSKAKALKEDGGIDWGFAEQLAWGTLLLEHTPVRLSGQDCARGTFSHRHAILYDIESREEYVPLMNMEGCSTLLCVHNSMLSEAAVLGFDYGYSLDYPQMLCTWEAQFGDFVNGAQVIIDQFISSSESKWQVVNGLVMLLPHGYEGQGPEHSSGRIERFLQLCAEDNLQVANLTTPAQYFHILRRQMKRDFRKPLIIMAPKSLLRHREAVSLVCEFSEGRFHEILDDVDAPEIPSRVILCSGKIYYDLAAYRKEEEVRDAIILRVEQLYPFHRKRLLELIDGYSKPEKIIWCQEETQNMGPWSYVAPILEEVTGKKPLYAGRHAAASPAVGSLALHRFEQASLVKTAFTL